MHKKVFSERFNRELVMLGFPEDLPEKVKAVKKVFAVKSHMAHAMILGHLVPSSDQLHLIAKTLEVCPAWLSGQTDKRKAYSEKEAAEN